MRVVYDCTVVEEGQGILREDVEEQVVADKRHSRAPSADLLVDNLRDEYDLHGGLSPRIGRSRQASVALNDDELAQEDVDEQEQMDIVRELTELCGDGGSEDEEELPEEVKQALRDLQDGAEGKRLVSCSLGTQYEIEISETTTTTTTVVRTTDSRTSTASAHEIDGPTPRTISRRTRTRPASILELGDEMRQEDDWVELGAGANGAGGGDDADDDEMLPSEENGQRGLAARARQDTFANPEESQQRLQVRPSCLFTYLGHRH